MSLTSSPKGAGYKPRQSPAKLKKIQHRKTRHQARDLIRQLINGQVDPEAAEGGLA